MKKIILLLVGVSMMLLAGCAKKVEPYDYSNFLAHQPKSIVVVPALNNSVDVNASNSVIARISQPLAEAGYYVFPVALVDETFKSNGIFDGNDVLQVSGKKLQQIFGADSALYISIEEYGTSYHVFSSVTTVSLNARLVDLHTGKLLWTGAVVEKYDPNQGQSNVLGAMIGAIANQIIGTINDQGYDVAGTAANELFATGQRGNILYGVKHPKYKKDPQLSSAQ